MRSLNFVAVALAATTVGAIEAQAFSLSSVSSLLSRVGVNVTLPDRTITLPARAEEAVQRAFSRAESVLDDVFDDDNGVDIDIDLDQIVNDALDRARERVEAARERAQQHIDAALDRAQERLDAALERARSVLDRLDIDLPEIDLPEVDLPDLDLDDLDDLVDDTLEDADGLLDELLDEGGIESGAVVNMIAPAPATTTSFLISSAGSSASFASFPVTADVPATIGVPEPTALAAIGALLAGLAGRRR